MMGRDKKVINNNLTHTLIASGTEVKGDVTFSGSLHVQGTIIGNIRSESDEDQITIGETGKVEGEIKVPRIIINGRVSGNVHSNDHIELAEKAEVEGNVFYNAIEMIMGARVNGKLVRREAGQHLPSPDDTIATGDDENIDIMEG